MGNEHLYLTFDDGPDSDWTPCVLDQLAVVGARATFFVVGERACRNAPLLRRIAAAGHSIGNHTWSHRHPWSLSVRDARNEVREGARAIADILGAAPGLFRPPHGRMRACMLEEAAAAGEKVVLWSISAMDWGAWGSRARISNRLARVQSGDIVLMHDGKSLRNRPEELTAVLPAFLQSLSEGRTAILPL